MCAGFPESFEDTLVLSIVKEPLLLNKRLIVPYPKPCPWTCAVHWSSPLPPKPVLELLLYCPVTLNLTLNMRYTVPYP